MYAQISITDFSLSFQITLLSIIKISISCLDEQMEKNCGCNKYRKFVDPKISYISFKILVPSITYIKIGDNNGRIFNNDRTKKKKVLR